MQRFKSICYLGLAILGCSRSNYLEIGKPATIIENQGMIIRKTPTANGQKIILVPLGQSVNVIAEGLPEKLYGIKSKWYQVRYGRFQGWMWGGLATSHGSKESSYSSALGKYDGLVDYAQKTFKQMSTREKKERAEPDVPCPPHSQSLYLFENGIQAMAQTVGPNCHPSSQQTLQLPGASLENGFDILRASGWTSHCEPLTFEAFRFANYDSRNLKNCRKVEYSFSEFAMRKNGTVLILETVVGGG